MLINVNVTAGFISHLLREELDENRMILRPVLRELSSCLFLLFTCYKSILFTLTHLGSKKLSFKGDFMESILLSNTCDVILKPKLNSIHLFFFLTLRIL